MSDDESDTMRPEYDFSQAERGLTAARYAEGTNVVVLDPDVAPFFPDHDSVNEALRHLVAVIQSQQRAEPTPAPDALTDDRAATT